MPDREKVISLVEDAIEIVEKEAFWTIASGLRDALSMLKEQEAVKPFSDDDGAYWCGSCHEDMVWHQKFCSNCGKPVNWEGW